jgi:phosphoribosyl-ATP pyrophosphohydrolase
MSILSFLLALLPWLAPSPLPKAPLQASQPMLNFPVPAGVANQLFYLQRDPNTNTIIYQLNVNSAGKIAEDEPINVFWLRYDEQGQRKDLNYIQRKFAYGLSAEKVGPEKYELKFAAYNKVPFYLMRWPADRAFHVFTVINNKQIVVSRVYLRIEGGTFWVPNVRYIEFKGWDATTRAAVVTRIAV